METVLALAIAVVIGAALAHFWPETAPKTPVETPQETLDALTMALEALDTRLETLESGEAIRTAQQAEALDKFTRLYKRLAERQSREDRSESTAEAQVNPEYLRRLKVR